MAELKPCPLVCGELKLMVGEPVWVVSAKRKEWCLVHSFHSADVIGGGIIVTTRTSQKITLPYTDVGQSWWAYKEKVLDEPPTIDAVPVVRCRDCFYNANGSCTMSEDYAETRYRPDYFCADGYRKEDDGGV